MSIKIEPRRPLDQHSEGGWSYIRIGGKLRDDIKHIAAWANKPMQDVGADLLEQAVAVVLPTIPANAPKVTSPRVMGRVRGK
jgi:hypothetical protein